MLQISLLYKKNTDLRVNNSRILKIKNAKLPGYYFYMNLNIWGDFYNICISAPLKTLHSENIIHHIAAWDKYLLFTTVNIQIFIFEQNVKCCILSWCLNMVVVWNCQLNSLLETKYLFQNEVRDFYIKTIDHSSSLMHTCCRVKWFTQTSGVTLILKIYNGWE